MDILTDLIWAPFVLQVRGMILVVLPQTSILENTTIDTTYVYSVHRNIAMVYVETSVSMNVPGP